MKYSISCCYEYRDGRFSGFWQILGYAERRSFVVVWESPRADGDDFYPADLRAEYERLVGRSEFVESEPSMNVNIVELFGNDDCAFDQPCAFGHRVDSHAVYCHNTGWLYAPRKCRRGKNIWTGEDWPHDQCRGYKPNLAEKGHA